MPSNSLSIIYQPWAKNDFQWDHFYWEKKENILNVVVNLFLDQFTENLEVTVEISRTYQTAKN